MKNDITYEYRVFTNRLIDIESMEVGKCTSKVLKELKQKDKVDGRFFHTSDTDEWFFCWNGKLQKLNLKGNSDVNAALEEVKKLIADANTAVSDAKKTATEAKNAAVEAKTAADAASAAVESIENKADKSDVVDLSKEVEEKADKSVVDTLTAKVDAIKVPEVPTKVSAFENDANYLTEHQDISGKQDVISDLGDIRSGAALGATALQAIPEEYVKETELAEKGYLTKDAADLLYAPIGTTGSGESIDLSKYAEIEYVNNNFDVVGSAEQALADAKADASSLYQLKGDYEAAGTAAGLDAAMDVRVKVLEEIDHSVYLTEHQDISGKQDVISDLEEIRANAELAKTALQAIPEEYITETELDGKGYLTEHQSLDNYYTKEQIDAMIGVAIEKTNTILA